MNILICASKKKNLDLKTRNIPNQGLNFD